VRDLNLAAGPAFPLDAEGGRPVYAPASSIDPASGAIPLGASRRDPRFANAYEIHSDLASEAGSLTFAASGLLRRWRASFQGSYTLGFARDQSSFTFGGPVEGFSRTETRGDPNRPEWAPGSMDRRHAFTGILGLPVARAWELSLVARALSGAPFTPRVSGDVNGDGARNDAAFVFDPAATADPALAAGMRRLLDAAPARAAGCLRAQLGTLAARNSCRGDWSHSLDLRLAHTPELGRLGRRLSLGLDVLAAPAGLDLLLHGNGGARGWGARGLRSDDVLLHPRGFDPATRSFRYEVNERFGRGLEQALGMRSPFGLQLSGRIALGPDRGPDPLGGFAGVGLGASGGTPMSVRIGGGEGAPSPGGAGMRFVGPGEGPAPGGAAMLDMLLPMPLDGILALRDSLALSEEQTRRLQEIRAGLVEANTPIRAEIGRALGGGAGAPTENPGALFERIGPRLNEGRLNVQRALDEVRETLSAEQWERVPAALRNAASRQIRVGG
jgi:hypothetical protein